MKPIDHYWSGFNLVSIGLLPLTALFCIIAFVRKRLYRLSILSSYRAPLPVIIIGNISVGGTGKTPFIIELVKQLQSRGLRPAVISRGYGGTSKQWPVVISENSSAQDVGDEPYLIHSKTGCPVVAGPDRRADIEQLLAMSDCNIILSDDGLQHYALERDREIAIVDAKRRFGNGLCLPSGPLRETQARLKQVDLILYNGQSSDAASFYLDADCYYSLQDDSELALSSLEGRRVHAVAGIGHPQRFFDMLSAKGIMVIPHTFADHHPFSETDFEFGDESPVLMTDKDAVKCQGFKRPDLYRVPVKLHLTDIAQARIDQLIDSVLAG